MYPTRDPAVFSNTFLCTWETAEKSGIMNSIEFRNFDEKGGFVFIGENFIFKTYFLSWGSFRYLWTWSNPWTHRQQPRVLARPHDYGGRHLKENVKEKKKYAYMGPYIHNYESADHF